MPRDINELRNVAKGKLEESDKRLEALKNARNATAASSATTSAGVIERLSNFDFSTPDQDARVALQEDRLIRAQSRRVINPRETANNLFRLVGQQGGFGAALAAGIASNRADFADLVNANIEDSQKRLDDFRADRAAAKAAKKDKFDADLKAGRVAIDASRTAVSDASDAISLESDTRDNISGDIENDNRVFSSDAQLDLSAETLKVNKAKQELEEKEFRFEKGKIESIKGLDGSKFLEQAAVPIGEDIASTVENAEKTKQQISRSIENKGFEVDKAVVNLKSAAENIKNVDELISSNGSQQDIARELDNAAENAFIKDGLGPAEISIQQRNVVRVVQQKTNEHLQTLFNDGIIDGQADENGRLLVGDNGNALVGFNGDKKLEDQFGRIFSNIEAASLPFRRTSVRDALNRVELINKGVGSLLESQSPSTE